MASSIPKFKSAYTPKTRYGQVVKEYYENNSTPSVNYMMGSNTEHKNLYGSDYGSEDVEAISREYVLYRDANGLSANYNPALQPWVDQVRASAKNTSAVGGVQPNGLPAGVASVGQGGTVIQPTYVPPAQESDPFYQQLAINKQIDNTKFENGVPVTAASPAPAPAPTPVAETVPTPAATPVPAASPTPTAEDTVTPTAVTTADNQNAAGDSTYEQIINNNAALIEQLNKSGLPKATIDALKARAGLEEIGKNYQAAVKQAENDYARAQSRYGQNAEYLAQSGLSNSGMSDASDNAAYAAMQGAKVSAGETALAEQESKQKTLWERVAEEETKLRDQEKTEAAEAEVKAQARETELLSFVTNKGLNGQEAINYLVSGGVDSARATELVEAQIDPDYKESIAKAAEAYIKAFEETQNTALAKNAIDGEYPTLMVNAAIEKANELMNSDAYKAQQQEKLENEAKQKAQEEAETLAAGVGEYTKKKAEGYNEEALETILTSAGYDYEAVKAEYDKGRGERLDNAFSMLNGNNLTAAQNELMDILGITVDEWNAEVSEGGLGDLMRSKADYVFANDATMRSSVYLNSITFELNAIDSSDTELVLAMNRLIDECSETGILVTKDIDKARKAIGDKFNVTYGADFDTKYKCITINNAIKMKFGTINLTGNQLDDVRWNEVSFYTGGNDSAYGSLSVGVRCKGDDKSLVFKYTDKTGVTKYYQVDNNGWIEASGYNSDEEKMLYDILIKKYENSGSKSTKITKANNGSELSLGLDIQKRLSGN